MRSERTSGGGRGRSGVLSIGIPRARWAALVAAPLALAATLVAADAWSKAPAKVRPPVAGVAVQAAGLGPNISGPLRRTVEGEARRLSWKDVPGGERVVLSTSLVRLDTTRRPGGPHVNAVVAVSVFGVERGDVKAVIEGSAEVRGEGEQSRRSAIAAAARGAVRNVPAAMRTSGAKALER
jgi:hypothetical protein